MGRKNTPTHINSDKNIHLKNNAEKCGKQILKESWYDKKNFHYGYEETLPYIYAMACVEIVATHSKEGGIIFCEIIDAWNKPNIKKFQNDFNSSLTKEESKEIQGVILEALKNIKKPFKELQELVQEPRWWKPILESKSEIEDLTPDEEAYFDDLFYGLWKVMEFIIVGFNRKSDIRKGKLHVLPTDNPPWLFLAVLYRTLSEHSKITMEDMRKKYKVVHQGDKTIDYEAILTGSPTNRERRRLMKYSKSPNLKLQHDKQFLDAAYLWYQCRVRYSSIEKYCDSLSQRKKIPDPKNVLREIKHCDRAIGYKGRIKK
jgi:hypothetical protein